MFKARLSSLSLNARRLAQLSSLSLIVALVSAVMIGCGKRKPPLPPLERVSQKVELTGFQRGGEINLKWQMPARQATPGSTLEIKRADIYRLAEPLGAPEYLTEEEFAARSILIASEIISEADFGRKTVEFRDRLEFAGQPVRLRYAIRLVNSSGQRAGFSNFLLIEPAARIAQFPTGLMAAIEESAIILKWDAPESNVDKSVPPNVIGYNVYRDGKQINSFPINREAFSDPSFEFGRKYEYFVRTVSLGTSGEPVESTDSERLALSPVDIFKPQPPSALTIAASPGSISIFFAANIERDIAGYKIYRSLDKRVWEEVSPGAISTNTFQDTKVISGNTYFYYIVAIDIAGNVSGPSEIVSELVP